jgi:serine/threonine protein kinase
MELDDRFRRIGKYKVLATVAIGGKCEVYKCLDPALNRYVAIKILAGEWARDTIVMEQFENAAKAAQRIQHGNVVRIYAVERTDDLVPYIVMEFVDGPSFADFIKNKVDLPYGRMAEMFVEASEGLLAAYHEGILHLDIKPSNLMVNARDDVKIIDFGIARSFREAVGRHRAFKSILGTPKYMSPEQCLGKTVDLRSDIYSLGATMYHMLTGQPPYDAESLNDIIAKQSSTQIVPIYIINPRVPNELADIVHAMLGKDPDERYQTYDHLIDELKRFQLTRVSKEGRMPREGEERQRPALQIQEEQPVLGTPGLGRPERVEVPSSRGGPALRQGSAEGAPTLRKVPPLAPEKMAPSRILLLMISVVLLFIAVLTLVFTKIQPKQDEGQTGKNLFSTIIQAVFKPKPKEEKMPPEKLFIYRCEQTMRHMQSLRDMIRGYIADKGKIPDSIQDLVDAGYVTEDSTLDGWGHQIVYIRMNGDLRSFGEDGEEDTTDDFRLNAEGRFYRVPPDYSQRKADDQPY